MTKLTLAQKLEIVNAINTAVANDKIVMADGDRITGAFIWEGKIYAVEHDNSMTGINKTIQLNKRNVQSFILTKNDVNTIYQPPNPADSNSSNSGDCDLSNANP